MITFTPEELLLYLYNEASPQMAASIESALKENWTLREKFEVLKASMQRLDKTILSPRTEVVLNILNYARETSVEQV